MKDTGGMGSRDLHQSDFYADPHRFADVFNGVLFRGKKVIEPQELEEADSTVAIPSESGGSKTICDKVWMWRGISMTLLVMENQTYVDYAMVFRVMESELLRYKRQKKRAYAKAKRKGTRFDRDEYLSRMKREQKFIPVLTLVVYLGTERLWDGAKTLHELLEVDEEVKPYINNYRLNFYDYHEEKDFSMFHTENRALFELLSRAGDEKRMEGIFREHPEWYDSLDEDSVRAIIGVTGISVDPETIRREDEEKGVVYNMCKAFEDHKEAGREEGRREGRAEGRREGRAEGRRETCLANLRSMMARLHLSAEQAMDVLNISGGEREVYRKLL